MSVEEIMVSNNFADVINFMDFELCKDENGYYLYDLQHVNLGNIDEDRFEKADEILDRMGIYIDDYYVHLMEEEYDKYFDTLDEWLAYLDQTEYEDSDTMYLLQSLEILTNHNNILDKVNLDLVVAKGY